MSAYRTLCYLSLLAFGALVGACDAQCADAPATTAAVNVNLVSEYRLRGIDQTWGRPAVQVDADLNLPDGVYAAF